MPIAGLKWSGANGSVAENVMQGILYDGKYWNSHLIHNEAWAKSKKWSGLIIVCKHHETADRRSTTIFCSNLNNIEHKSKWKTSIPDD